MNKALLIRMGRDKLGWHEYERSVIKTDEYLSLKNRKRNYKGKLASGQWCSNKYKVRVYTRVEEDVELKTIYIWQENDNLLPVGYW